MWDWLRNLFPYTDFHELNADWLLKTAKEAAEKADAAYTAAEPLPAQMEELETRMTETEGRVGRLVDEVFDLEPYYVDFTVSLTNGWISSSAEINCNRTLEEITEAFQNGARIVARIYSIPADLEDPLVLRYVTGVYTRAEAKTIGVLPQIVGHLFNFATADGILQLRNSGTRPFTWYARYYVSSADDRQPA